MKSALKAIIVSSACIAACLLAPVVACGQPADDEHDIVDTNLYVPPEDLDTWPPDNRWIEIKDETVIGENSSQISEYCIADTPNADGSVTVYIRTTQINHRYEYIQWTTTKTLYCDGEQVAYIGEDYRTVPAGDRMTQYAKFDVRGGGTHHITSEEKPFRGGTEITTGWNFPVDVPYVITANAETGGSIDPAGALFVYPGKHQKFNIKADDGYRIKAVLVDGADQGPLSTYELVSTGADHTITAQFQKTWTVTFCDVDDEVLQQDTVDDGSSVIPPEIPEREGYTAIGWDAPLDSVGSDLTVHPVYEANICVRVPTRVACTIASDGSVITPSSYEIENLSVVPVASSTITARGVPDGAHIELDLDSQCVFSSDNGLVEPFVIPAQASECFTWHIDPLDPKAHRDLIDRAVEGPTTFCTIDFTFEAVA